MGLHIELMGRISVTPRLNPGEVEYLRALAWAGPARDGTDPYAVPAHPRLDVLLRKADPGSDRRLRVDGEPPMGCGWSPCVRGCCIAWSGQEKFYYPADWLRFLVEHLLGPDARAKGEVSPDLDGFTFDHSLDGVVAVSCAETEEFWLIVAKDNEIEEVLLARGDCQEGFWPRLPGALPLDPLDPSTYADGVVRRRIEGVRYAVRERTA